MRCALASLLLILAASSAAACPVPSVERPVEIYPTAEELPANLLRFFVYFPRPMNTGGILDHIALVDDTGSEVAGALLGNRYDLWSPGTTRLTVLLDPGRVKTGLAAHDALGRALDPGQRYSLVVRGKTIDAQGCELGADTVYNFTAGPADFAAPAPGDWTLSHPATGSREPLTVNLGSPHDHLSLVYRIRVLEADGKVVPGRIDLGDGESHWHFTPASPWQNKPYRLAIDPRLEDLAGNRPGALFDRPIGAPIGEWVKKLDWSPKPAAP